MIMIKSGTFIFVFLLSVFSAYSQLSRESIPPGFSNSKLKSTRNDIPSKELPPLNIHKLLKEDQESTAPTGYAIHNYVDIRLKEEGIADTLPGGGIIWRYRISSPNAFSLNVVFSNYHLPPEAELFLYNEDHSVLYGAFTDINNNKAQLLATADMPGNVLIIEYYEPANAIFSCDLVIESIGQGYRDIFSLKSTQQNELIDINCVTGDTYQLEKYAVAKMSFRIDDKGYNCTGTLINNVANPGEAFFLTANHCISTPESANTLVTYFNYERETCNGRISPGNSLSGSTLLATEWPSDFTLLRLNNNPPSGYRPYFAGWSLEDSVIRNGFGIHHPGGSEKKISVDHDTILSYPDILLWEDDKQSTENTHWMAAFDEGSTSQGSSGSPLFDQDHRLTGQLHGGTDSIDFFGKFSYSYDPGRRRVQKLKPYLNPDGIKIEFLDGYAPEENPPAAHFYTEFQDVCTKTPVQLFNNSAFGPGFFEWNFDPVSVTYIEGNANSESPVVQFEENKSYTISLTVQKNSDINTRVRPDYIRAGQGLSISVRSSKHNNICYSEFTDNILFIASGAERFTWQLENHHDKLMIDTTLYESDTLMVTGIDTADIDSTITFHITATGYHGDCIDSATFAFKVIRPINDDIENAIPLSLGENGPFNNFCATTRENEPHPPGGDCNTQETWCDCNISEIILDNSVWFTFTGPPTGIISVDAPGFDNQIAIYEADSHAGIISGDESDYKIVAANDDFFGEEKGYSALIKGASVIPGKTYWLQVDGSACGAYGYFNLILSPETYNSLRKPGNENTALYTFPNPAKNELNVMAEETHINTVIDIISIDGRTVINKYLPVLNQHEKISINVSGLENGIYLLSIRTEDRVFTKRIMIKR